MDELTLDGKIYLSSKQAAKITGYAKDYIGQLCREGRVEARLVGRSWYVLEESLKSHRFTDKRKAEAAEPEDASVEEPRMHQVTENQALNDLQALETEQEIPHTVSDIASIEAVLSTPRYIAEEPAPLPIVDPEPKMSEESERQIEHLQDAWSSWFTYAKDGASEPHATPEPSRMAVHAEEEPQEAIEEPQSVPLRRVVEVAPPAAIDIAPLPRQAVPHFSPVLEEATVIGERIIPRKAQKPVQQGNNRILYAFMVTGIVLLVIVTSIVTGLSEELLASPNEGPLLDFLQGETKIEK